MSASKSTGKTSGKTNKRNDEDDLASYLASFKNSLDTRRVDTCSSAWLKKPSVEELDLHKLDAGRSSPSTNSSSNGVTSDLEDYMNEIDQIDDNHNRSKDVTLIKSNNTTSLSDSSSVSNLHGKIFTFEDLEHEQLVSDSSEDNDNNLMTNIHMAEEIQRNDSITTSQYDSYSIEEEESESKSISSDNDSSIDISKQDNLMTNVHIIDELEDSETESSNPHSSLALTTTNTSESQVTLVESDEDYSMEYDTDISETSEDKENVHFGTGSAPSIQKRQTDHLLKDQSCQTTSHTLPHPTPLSHPSSFSHPLLPYTLSPEELEVLTAYSPATVALHDLVKSQVELTKRLINQSRTLSDHVTGSTTPTYQYVTLDQTKEFIANHKPKVLSYQEALKRVRKDSK